MADTKPAEGAQASGGITFDFSRATSGMGDLMRRLYNIRVECGEMEDEKAKQKAEEEKLKAMKKLDPFEYQKVMIMQKVDSTRSMVKQREEDPDDKKLSNNIRKQLQTIDEEYDKLKDLQQKVRKGLGIWTKVKIDNEIRQQREDDVKNIGKHIENLKAANRKVTSGGKDEDSGKKKYKNKAKFDDVDSMPDAKEEELPTIDISEGLAQIEANKKKQNDLLDDIEKQVDQMAALASGFKEELQLQEVLLNKIEKDVDKYNKQLEGLNGKLDKAIEAVGGSCRLVFILIGLIVCFAVAGIVYLAVSNAIKGVNPFS